MPDFNTEPHDLLELEEEPSMEELQDQVQRAQSELIELKRRQDQIEKEKLRLEELSRRQEELERGRLEMVDKLTRSLLLVQRETEESQRRLEQLHGIQDSFAEHLRELEHIDCKSWNGRELARELTRAIGTVDEAKAAYSRAQAKIAPMEAGVGAVENGVPYGDDFELPSQGFMYWLQSGLAFTLPLVVLGLIALLIWSWHLLTAPR
jgi:molecular chaperone GrpE (heat shock protein)